MSFQTVGKPPQRNTQAVRKVEEHWLEATRRASDTVWIESCPGPGVVDAWGSAPRRWAIAPLMRQDQRNAKDLKSGELPSLRFSN
jgi:hypothetical protein